jgi:transaldolase
MTKSDPLATLAGAGVSIWLDDLSRDLLVSGELARLIREDHVVGVTSNPSIFAAALSHGEAYAGQVRELAAAGADPAATVRALTTTDVRDAADLFRDVYRATGGTDGRVSIEVDPRLARDTEGTVAQARELWAAVDRPNIFVKIPATEEGLPAIAQTLAAGISVNVTLIFSPARYREVIDAFFTGLEQAGANGHDVTGIESVASFFVSRMDSEVDGRLEKIGTDEAKALQGQAAVANARLAYGVYEDLFATERWQALKTAGANPQRPLWASTSVKNPSYPDTLYVDQLVAPGVVNTMPGKTLRAIADHGVFTGDTVRGEQARAAAQEVFERLTAAGIDLDDVYRTLEDEGLEKFTQSWSALFDGVRDQLAEVTK